MRREWTVEVERRIAASPETLFSYLTDPDKFVAWMGSKAVLDPRPGGRFRITVESANVAVGEYREVEPPARLLMTWGWEGSEAIPPGSTTVEITLRRDGAGTLFRLRHTGFRNEEDRGAHQGGWEVYASRLEALFG